MRHSAIALLALLIWMPLLPARAEHPTTQPTSGPDSRPGDAATDKSPAKPSITEQEVSVNGAALRYRATAGKLTVRDDADKPKADFFFIAYEKLPLADDPSTRPVTYVFNGGPGSASVWLHVGAAGPRRLAMDDNGDPPTVPCKLEDNADTWLTATDLVFIDPVGTGYSRPAPGEKGEQFYGVQEDVKWVAEFIRLYTTRYQRWTSPKYLAGESYGTTRAAALSDYLLQADGISVNGIVLISSVLNFQTLDPTHGNDLPFALYVPTYAATAWYHKRLAPPLQGDLQKTIDAAREWANGPYAAALTQGNSLSSDQRKTIADQLAAFTGLSAAYVERSDLRINPSRFEKMLLDDKRELIGRFDGRIIGYDPDAANDSAEYDPSFAPYLAAYSSVINDYLRRTLKYESDAPYEVLTGKVQPWNFGPGGNGFLDVSAQLQNAMLGNPRMRVLFASGYFDLATPFETATYTIDHLHLSDELRSRISHKFYEGGHMIYHYRPSLKKLGEDVRAFVTVDAK